MPKDKETERRILLRAAELFERRGFSPVTMDELAAGLGMSKKTLYLHFASKEALARAALDETFREIDRELLATHESEGRDFSERLRRHILVVAERYGRLETALLEDLFRSQPALYKRFLELSQKTVKRHFGGLVAAGVRAGAFRADLDTRMVMFAVVTLSSQIAKPAVLAELGMSPRQAFQSMIDLLLDGLKVRGRIAKKALKSRAR